MGNEQIQNLRYKLQKRVRRLNSSDWQVFHYSLKQFWGFLLGEPQINGILELLESKTDMVLANVDKIFDSNSAQVFETEVENVIASYLVLKRCVASEKSDIEINIGHQYNYERKHNDCLDGFRDLFVEPLYDYIDETLDESGSILHLLRKFKHKCEWFQRKKLFELWQDNTEKGEYLLTLNLYEFLFDQGIDFSIEPTSASGEADLVTAQASDTRVIADAKIFNPEKSKGKHYLAKGFQQIYTYTLDYNEPYGFLIIFKTCPEDLKLPFSHSTRATPCVKHNSKTIFFLVVDIFPHEKSASQRGKLSGVELSEDDLWISDEKSP